MAYAPNTDRAAELRRYADMIGKTVTPMGAPAAPYSNPNWARLAQALIGGAFQGAATRAAAREDERARLASGNLARVLTGGQPIDVRMPRPTGPLAGMDRLLLGRDETIADDGSAIPVSPMGPDGEIDMESVISQSIRGGIDPLSGVTAALTLGKTRADLAAAKLTTERANNLREATSLYWKIQEADGPPDATQVARLRELSANLPAELPPVGYETIDVAGKAALVQVDILGRPVGSPVFAPAPLIDRGVSETAKLEAKQKVEGSVAEIAADKEFGKEYSVFVAGGGFADVTTNREKVRAVLEDLKRTGKDKLNLTGTDVGALTWPNRIGLSLFNEKALNALETVEEVVQRNLRVILGAQFTEKEGTRLIARAYNPWLSEETNALRLERLLDSMDTQLEAKFDAIKWYEDNQTLRGFKGDLPDLQAVQSIADSLVEGVPDAAVIMRWDNDYIDSLMTHDGRVTDELRRIMADPAAKEALIRRGIELKREGFGVLITE
jgi:hypothetical protein